MPKSFIAAALVAAVLFPAAARAAEIPKPSIHVGSIYATKVGSGPKSLVLIPGLGCGPWTWEGFIAKLAPEYTAYAVTLAGFDGTAPVTGPARFDGYVRSLARLIREQHLDRPVIIGHSMGGELALRLGETEPSLPRGIVLVDSLPLFPPLQPGETMEGRRTSSQAMTAKMKSASPNDYAASETAAVAALVRDPATAKTVAERTLKSDRDTVADSAYELATTDLHGDLGNVTAPVLVLAAGDNGYPLAGTRAFYAQQYHDAPTATVTVIPDARHFIMLDQPETFSTAVLGFITGLK
jgi:pimeloyl-ACP methyl ester carboxylesterase